MQPHDSGDVDHTPAIDYHFPDPAAAEQLRRILNRDAPEENLIHQVNQAAHAAHDAAARRDGLIRIAIADGVDLDQLAIATGLTHQQLHRINLTDPGADRP